MKAAVIVNPRAGGGAAGRRWPSVRPELEKRLGRVEVRVTQSPGHGTALARELAAAGFDPIVAAGGDGTLDEVANGILAARSDARLGVLPLASGGDFARMLGLATIAAALEVLAAGESLAADAVRARFRDSNGEAGERYFINAASIGLGAVAALGVRGWKRLLPARVRYLAAAAPALARRRAFAVCLRLDGGPPFESSIATIILANGRYAGAGLLLAPAAEIADGLMEVVLVERLGLAEVAANAKLLYSGAIDSYPKVRHWRARRVEAEGERVPLELDGEPVGTLPLEAEMLPGCIRILCPAGFSGATHSAASQDVKRA